MRLGAVLVVLAAGVASADEPRLAGPDDLRFNVVATSGEVLRVKARVTNEQEDPVLIAFGACSMAVRLYRTADRSGAAVWDSAKAARPCPPYLVRRVVDPKASLSARELALTLSAHDLPPASPRKFTLRFSGRDLPESVKDGTYFASVVVRMAEPRMKSSELPAGKLVVRRR